MFHSKILWIVATLLLSTSGKRSFPTCRRYICFIEPMAIIPKEPYVFHPHHVDPNLCTHMSLSSMRLAGNKLDIALWHAEKRLTNMYEQMKQFKRKKPKIQMMLTVGDNYPNSLKFSKMASTVSGRREFISSLIPFLREQGFDGVDIDWFFPGYFGGAKSDKETYAALIKEIATEFVQESSSDDRKRLLLSASAPRADWLVIMGYNVTEFASYVDFINILTSGYNLQVNTPIKHWSPLDSSDGGNIKESVKYWVDRGMPKVKINIAIVAFSHRVYTKSSSDIKFGKSVIKGEAKTEGRGRGYLTHYQNWLRKLLERVQAKREQKHIAKMQNWTMQRDTSPKPKRKFQKTYSAIRKSASDGVKTRGNLLKVKINAMTHTNLKIMQKQTCSVLKQGGKVYWDSFASAPYHIIDNYFLSFENKEGIKDKVRFIREHKFGGVVFRGPQEDDYLGLECGKGPYPLLRTIKQQCTIKMY
ncbi:unnamed protein product [Lymnaea stagnalis]|uniref:GH18 domain-containing protein n=1 Tax=Lymnaea stagnalis TaxID=6523 RepID=A0AAV2IDT5_LYMST